MRFMVEGSRIICGRKGSAVQGDDVFRRVVEFDEHVDTVPPHVAARLTAHEVRQLREFMADRKRIQANPVEKNMLEVLPGLLQEATKILESVDRVNSTMYEQLSGSISHVRSALENVKPARKGRSTPIKHMHEPEAQKARLENIKQEL